MTIFFPSLCTFSYTLLAFSRLHASRNLLVHARQHFPLFFFLITVTSSFPHRGQRFIFARNQNSWIAICAVKTLVFVICITFSPCRKTKIVLIVSIFNFFFHLSPSILMRIKKKKSYEKSLPCAESFPYPWPRRWNLLQPWPWWKFDAWFHFNLAELKSSRVSFLFSNHPQISESIVGPATMLRGWLESSTCKIDINFLQFIVCWFFIHFSSFSYNFIV